MKAVGIVIKVSGFVMEVDEIIMKAAAFIHQPLFFLRV